MTLATDSPRRPGVDADPSPSNLRRRALILLPALIAILVLLSSGRSETRCRSCPARRRTTTVGFGLHTSHSYLAGGAVDCRHSWSEVSE